MAEVSPSLWGPGQWGVSQGRFSVAQSSSPSGHGPHSPFAPLPPLPPPLRGSFQGSASHLTAVRCPEHGPPRVSLPAALEAVWACCPGSALCFHTLDGDKPGFV